MAVAIVAHSQDATALLTTQEVADLLRVSPRTVQRLGACGRLQRIRFGYKLVRYTPDSVAALLAPENSEDRVTIPVLAEREVACADRPRRDAG